MGLQSQRRTSSSKRRRASHFAIKMQQPNSCPNCHEPIRGHALCSNCGHYKGKQVIKVKTALDKKKKK